MSDPTTLGASAKKQVVDEVKRLSKSHRRALALLSKKDVAASQQARKQEQESEQREIFEEAIKAHIEAEALKKGGPRKLEFGWNSDKQCWVPQAPGRTALAFRISDGDKCVVAPQLLSAAVGVDLPTGWTWERKSVEPPSQEGDWRARVQIASEELEKRREKEAAEKEKEYHYTTGQYKFQPGEDGFIFIRWGEPPDGFLLPTIVKDPEAMFKQRGGMLFLRIDGVDYRVAKKMPRSYFATMEAYAIDAGVTIPGRVTKGDKVSLPYPNNNYALVAPVTGRQFWGMDVVRERVSRNANNDVYQVEPADGGHENIVGQIGRACVASDAPDFAGGVCNGATLYLERTGFTRRPGGPPAIVAGPYAIHERRLWRVARMFDLESTQVDTSTSQLHCYAGTWRGIRIHYSIDFQTVDVADAFDVALGHLTLELGNWERGNDKFYRYWFDGTGVAGPGAGPDYAYEQYTLRLGDAPRPAKADFVRDVRDGLRARGEAFRQRHGF